MLKTKLTSKGQVTLSKDLRRRLGLQPGDEIEFVEDEHGYRVQKLAGESPFTRWLGFLEEYRGRSSDEMVSEMRDP